VALCKAQPHHSPPARWQHARHQKIHTMYPWARRGTLHSSFRTLCFRQTLLSLLNLSGEIKFKKKTNNKKSRNRTPPIGVQTKNTHTRTPMRKSPAYPYTPNTHQKATHPFPDISPTATHMHALMHTHTHTHTHACAHTHTHTHARTHARTHTYTRT